MAKAPPSFQFYPGDFVMGTAHLDTLAIGSYLLLLCFQWSHKQLPAEVQKLALICKLSEAEFGAVWQTIGDKFITIEGGGYINERLESVREKAVALSEQRSKQGQKGGLAKASRLLKQKRSKGSMKYEDRSKKFKERKVDVDLVVTEYQKHHPRSRPGEKELTKIEARLDDGFTVDDLALAIQGCHVSPFHAGQNDSGAKYQSLELIVRDAGKVSSFIEAAGEHGGPVLTAKTKRSMAAIESWLANGEQNGEAR